MRWGQIFYVSLQFKLIDIKMAYYPPYIGKSCDLEYHGIRDLYLINNVVAA